MKPFDIPVVPLMTQHSVAGAYSQPSSSVSGISSGLGGMSLNSSPQPNQGCQGQYGYPPQAQGGYSNPNQGGSGYSPLGEGQHGPLLQTGQGQYGQPNQAGQGQYGQPNQATGQGQYGQPNQAGQSPGGFDTYPDMSSNSQPFDGNKPYGGNPNPTSNGGSSYPQGQTSYPHVQGSQQQQQQQSYPAQQGNGGGYAAYPDLTNGNNVGYNQGVPMLTVPAIDLQVNGAKKHVAFPKACVRSAGWSN